MLWRHVEKGFDLVTEDQREHPEGMMAELGEKGEGGNVELREYYKQKEQPVQRPCGRKKHSEQCWLSFSLVLT